MIYKFLVGSEESENFKLEIKIDSEDTFMRLRNTILDASGYSKEQMDSFYICDDDWHKEKEVTVMDMGSDSDEDVWIMDDTPLDELLDEEGQKLKFVFDYMTERYFYMVLKETIPGKSLHDPLCTRKEGKAPKETTDYEEPAKPVAKIPDATIEDLGEEFYGDESFNEDELGDLDEYDGGDDGINA
ncbi:MAG: hypothetical protein PUF74_09345 [Sodaliphilus pleomorphus]|jgi:hypothetical protein|uniref:IS1096 element passenger TnpR family protein n=1 Tax=Sodaliphilus pleomorphus TaxID=2606626 RepID=UPI00240A2D49|nr:hypothetical protein [Sodaliphilus pleomorphus]MDD6475710.1 hypothetical protein [Sodaliphilus pleomorphus]MDD6687670.1 hypothetical protein [Sodaliphilus pleomorphus]MDY6260336.1 hypothetical protein [Bacteroidales bacterium]